MLVYVEGYRAGGGGIAWYLVVGELLLYHGLYGIRTWLGSIPYLLTIYLETDQRT